MHAITTAAIVIRNLKSANSRQEAASSSSSVSAAVHCLTRSLGLPSVFPKHSERGGVLEDSGATARRIRPSENQILVTPSAVLLARCLPVLVALGAMLPALLALLLARCLCRGPKKSAAGPGRRHVWAARLLVAPLWTLERSLSSRSR